MILRLRFLNILCAFVLVFIAKKAFSQPIELFRGFDLSNVQPGDSFAVEILNAGKDAITFYPLTVLDSSYPYLFLDEQNYFLYLKSSGSQTGALKAHARVVKSAFFINGNTPVNEFKDNVFDKGIANKKYGFPQWFLTSCNYLCGEYWAMASNMLNRSKLFDNDSIWDFNISRVHSLGEGVIKGDTVLIDFDPSMPRFLDTMPDGSYMNALDVFLHPEYFNSQGYYNVCNEEDSCWINEATIKFYPFLFRNKNLFTRNPIRDIDPQNLRGTWTLCSGCSIILEVKIPEFVVDLSDSINKMLFDSVITLLVNHSGDRYLFGKIAKKLFKTTDIEKGYEVLNNFDFIFSHELRDIFSSNFFARKYTSFKLKIPSSSKGYSLNDLYFPLAINEISSDSGLVIDKIDISCGHQSYKLWNDKGILDDNENFTVQNNEYNFVQNIIISPDNSVEMKLYYNQLLYKIFESFSADFFSAKHNIIIKSYPNNK